MPESKKELSPYPRAVCRICHMRSAATLFKDGRCINEIACSKRVEKNEADRLEKERGSRRA